MKTAGLQRVKVQTELPNSEIPAADNVWVPAAMCAGDDKKIHKSKAP